MSTGVTWTFYVDWDNDGSFEAAENEAARMLDLHVRRGREFKLKPEGDGFEYPRVGELNVTLDNYDRRYDPYNSSSPLYTNLLPGRRFKLTAEDNDTSTVYDVIHGLVDDIQPVSGRDQVTITCVDDLAILRDTDLETDLYLANEVDAIVLQILKECDLYHLVYNVAVNGTFASDTGWTKGTGWTIASGKADCAEPHDASNLFQAVLVVGDTYKITYTVSTFSLGTVTVYAGTTAGTPRAAIGTYTEVLTCAGNVNLIFTADADFVGKIDDVICLPLKCSIDAVSETIPYWWASNMSALSAFEKLCDATVGQFFVARDGTFKWYSRYHAYSSTNTITSDEVHRVIQLPQPWETVRNYIRVTAHLRSEESSAEILWTLGDTPYLLAGETREFWAQNWWDGEDVVCDTYVTFVSTVDYTAFATSAGTGTEYTTSMTVTDTQFALTRKITVTNSHATDPFYITLLQSRGKPVTSDENVIIREDTASQVIYKKKKFAIDSDWLQESNVATDFANHIKTQLAAPGDYPRVIFIDQPAIQFGMDLFDFHTLTISALSINGNYHPAYIEHNWSAGNAAETAVYYEPSFNYGDLYWIFPASVGVTTIFGY